jgi:hypothetical protein
MATTISKARCNVNWTQNGTIVAGGNGSNQLYDPYDIYVDDDQTVYWREEWPTCSGGGGRMEKEVVMINLINQPM